MENKIKIGELGYISTEKNLNNWVSAYLGMLSVASFLFGSLILVSVAYAKDPEQVPIGRLHIRISLNQSLPLLHHASQFVRGKVHTMEIGQYVVSLHIFGDELELTERPFRIIVRLQISQ